MQQRIRQVFRTGIMGATAVAAIAACSKGDAANSTPTPGTITASSTVTQADTDIAAQGSGFPAGYVAQFDRANTNAADVSYSEKEPGRWEVKTGPAHILYAAKDTARGKYSVSATFEQLEAPMHPEAFGVFIGGSGLDQPATRKYTYFIVRGDGKYMVKVRDGADTRTVTEWTTSSAVPKQDANGKGLYGIRVDVDGNSAKVSVNGSPVTTISGKDVPVDGIAGVRINHNLHLLVTPVSVTR